MGKFTPGNKAFLIESGRIIREVEIIKNAGGFYLIRFTDTGGGIKVKEHRLFATYEDADATIPKKPKSHRSPYDWL